MKKFALVLLVFILVFMCVSCSSGDVESTQTETQLHTLASPKVTDNLEWCTIYADVFVFTQSGEPILSNLDLTSFALEGEGDDAHILFKLNDEAKATINERYDELKDETLTLYIGEDEICQFTLSEKIKTGVFSVGDDLDYETLCEISTKLRGLDE